MRSDDGIQAAKSNLANARRLLDSGDAVNWVSGHLGSALHWAMEGWLLANGHTVSHGRGWSDTREAFLILGPDEQRSQLITLYAQTVSLEFQLMGDSDTAPTLSIAEWQIKARECLENTDKAIHRLLAGIPRQPRRQARARVHNAAANCNMVSNIAAIKSK